MSYSAAALRQASFCVELVGLTISSDDLKDMESLTSTMIVMWTIQTFCRLRLILWDRLFVLEDPEAWSCRTPIAIPVLSGPRPTGATFCPSVFGPGAWLPLGVSPSASIHRGGLTRWSAAAVRTAVTSLWCVFCPFPCGGRFLTFIGPSCPLQRHLDLAGDHRPPRLGHAQARTGCLRLSLRRGWFWLTQRMAQKAYL